MSKGAHIFRELHLPPYKNGDERPTAVELGACPELPCMQSFLTSETSKWLFGERLGMKLLKILDSNFPNLPLETVKAVKKNRKLSWMREKLTQRERKRKARKKEYRRYLKSEEWKLIRHRKMEMDLAAHRCENNGCGKRAEQVHHLQYPERFGQESMDDLKALCGNCHLMEHGRIPPR